MTKILSPKNQRLLSLLGPSGQQEAVWPADWPWRVKGCLQINSLKPWVFRYNIKKMSLLAKCHEKYPISSSWLLKVFVMITWNLHGNIGRCNTVGMRISSDPRCPPFRNGLLVSLLLPFRVLDFSLFQFIHNNCNLSFSLFVGGELASACA